MRLLPLVGDVLVSKWFWTSRLLTTGISLALIWRISMTDYLAQTPTEFVPVLLAIGIVFALIFTYVRAIPAYNDLNKEKLRAGTITEKIKYGMDYMMSDIIGFISAIVLAVVVPGVIYTSYLHAEPDLWGCALIAFVIAMVVGYGGTAVLHKIIDTFRDNAKVKELLKK
ncbi:MAG: hypothetical protein E7Z65_06500 [Thermoplasmata archaeon]|nr:hypothetical protein [Thermoplasmata archaeon]